MTNDLFHLQEASLSLIRECQDPVIANKMNSKLFLHIASSSIQYLDRIYEGLFRDQEKTTNWPFEHVDLNHLKTLKTLAASQMQRYIYWIRIHVSYIQNWNYEQSFPFVNWYLKMIENKLTAMGELNHMFFFHNDIDMLFRFSIVKDIGNMQNAKQMTSRDLKELHDKTDRLDTIMKSFYERTFSDSEKTAIEDGWEMPNFFGNGTGLISDKNNLLQSLAELSIRFKIARNRLETYEDVHQIPRVFYKNYRILINHLVSFIQKELMGRLSACGTTIASDKHRI